MPQQRLKQILALTPEKQPLTVRGWVRTVRAQKELMFIALNDGSCLANLQIVVDLAAGGRDVATAEIATGASLEVTGTLEASPKPEQPVELHASAVTVLGGAPQDYPLQKKRHSFEFLREIAHLRPRTNTFGAVTRVRNALSYAIHTFFQERGFLYIHTPIITSSDCEGAGEMFQVTTLPLDKAPLAEGQVDYTKDFFGKKTGLTVSGQLEAENFACALGNVYTFGPTFRAEHSQTTRHAAEFWMIEPEMAFCDIDLDMDVAEEFLKYIIGRVLEDCREDMEFFDTWVDPGRVRMLERVVAAHFKRITYTEGIDALLTSGEKFEYPVKWGMDLQSEHEKYLTEKVYDKPVIITGFPKEIKAFYMKRNDDGKTVRAMDVLVPKIGEIIGGSEREDDYEKLRERIRETGLPEKDYWWYLELRKYGSVPHSGFGLGFERLIMFVTGMQNIRDVVPFPRTYGSAEF